MKLRMMTSLTALLAALLLAPGALAQGDDDARVRKDLGAVLALQGKPCGKVNKAVRKGDNDYEVTCENGERYRIRIDANERVVVTDLD
jgi:hypothetical protein